MYVFVSVLCHVYASDVLIGESNVVAVGIVKMGVKLIRLGFKEPEWCLRKIG